jgi:hypothetical protein
VAGLRRALVFGLAALALAGCSANPDANPAPVKLDDLDLKPYADKPCTLLNADQLSEYRISKPGITDLSTCELKPDDPAAVRPLLVSISIGDWGAAKHPRKVAGYPADENTEKDAGLPANVPPMCIVRVLVAPKQQVVVSAGGEDPCHLAENVATSAIGTIKQHSP